MGGKLCKSGVHDGSHGIFESHTFKQGLPREYIKQSPFKFYERMCELGSGSMGAVMKVNKKPEYVGGVAKPKKGFLSAVVGSNFSYAAGSKRNLIFAMKRIIMEKVTPEFLEELKNEVDILRTLDHPNIVKLYEIYDVQDQMYLVMEVCTGGDLWARVPYTEKEAAKITRKLVSVVAHMHDSGITHRDLKMENVLFESHDENAEIKVIDFGLSKKFHVGEEFTSRVGSFYTMAPQVLQGVYTAQSDMWALGVLCYILLANEKPFAAEDKDHVINRIFRCDYNFDNEIWEYISRDAKDFISQLIEVDPKKRLTPHEANKTPWISNQDQTDTLSSEFVKKIHKTIVYQSESSLMKKIGLLILAHNAQAEDIGGLRRAFQEYDTDNDGIIKFDDFKNALQKHGYTDEEVKYFFSKLDVYENGLVYFTEFLAATLEAKGKIEESRLADAFSRIDVDASGYISKENIKKLLGVDYDEELVDSMIKELDKSCKGEISFEEFKLLFTRQYSMVSEMGNEPKTIEISFDNEDEEKLLTTDAYVPGGKHDVQRGNK